MSTSPTSKFTTFRLTGPELYPTWLEGLLIVLRVNGCVRHATGTRKAPADETDSTAYERWEDKNDIATGIIMGSISQNLQTQFIQARSAKVKAEAKELTVGTPSLLSTSSATLTSFTASDLYAWLEDEYGGGTTTLNVVQLRSLVHTPVPIEDPSDFIRDTRLRFAAVETYQGGPGLPEPFAVSLVLHQFPLNNIHLQILKSTLEAKTDTTLQDVFAGLASTWESHKSEVDNSNAFFAHHSPSSSTHAPSTFNRPQHHVPFDASKTCSFHNNAVGHSVEDCVQAFKARRTGKPTVSPVPQAASHVAVAYEVELSEDCNDYVDAF